jgi:hypothetical protein
VSFRRESTFAILAAVDDILQTFPLSRFRDFCPVQILAGFGVIDDIRERACADLALAAGSAGVKVRGGIDVGSGCGGFGWGWCIGLGWEGGEVGLEVCDLAGLRWRGEVRGWWEGGFAAGLVLFGEEEMVVPGWEAVVTLVEKATVVAERLRTSRISKADHVRD